jgi:integrase/recombinase XerD
LYEAVSILLRTGMRSNELCTLKLKDVDFENKYIILDPKNTKNKKSRIIPICDKVLNIFKFLEVKAKEECRDYFIHTRTGGKQTPEGLLRRFRNLLNNLESSSRIKIFKTLNIHDFRSTYISHMLETEPIVKVMKAVGHKNWKTTEEYFDIINMVNPNSLKY